MLTDQQRKSRTSQRGDRFLNITSHSLLYSYAYMSHSGLILFLLSYILKFTFYPLHTYTVTVLTFVFSATDNETRTERHDNSKAAQILYFKLVYTLT